MYSSNRHNFVVIDILQAEEKKLCPKKRTSPTSPMPRSLQKSGFCLKRLQPVAESVGPLFYREATHRLEMVFLS